MPRPNLLLRWLAPLLAVGSIVADGGFKLGYAHGKTDDFDWSATEDIDHVHDLHATTPHQLGIDHTKLTVRSQGRDSRLTDVADRVEQKLVA